MKLINEIKEALLRIEEYLDYLRKHPKSERSEIDEVILRSYREVLFKWFMGLMGLILLHFIIQLFFQLFIHTFF